MIGSVLRKLLDSFVVRKHVAMDATQQGDGNFQDRNKEVIRGLTDRSITHQCGYVSTSGLDGGAHLNSRILEPQNSGIQVCAALAFLRLLLRKEEDKVGFSDDVETGAMFHKNSGLLVIHVVGYLVD